MKKGIIFLITICLFFSINLNLIGKGTDYIAHYNMAVSRSNTTNLEIINPTYAPLFPTISSFISVEEKYFKYLIIFLVFFITPLLLMILTKKWYASLFYFSVTNYAYVTIAGFYPQALMLCFFLGIIIVKDDRIRTLLFFLGIFSHSQAFTLLGITWVLLLIHEKKYFDKFFLFCSPFWGTKVPSVLTTPFVDVGHEPSSLTINDFLGIVLKKTPLPFVWKAFEYFYQKKMIHYILLGVIGLMGGIFLNDRAFDLLAIVTVIGFTLAYDDIRNKFSWNILLILYSFLHFINFLVVSSKPC